MAKETAAEQDRNPDGTFAPKDDGGDSGERTEAVTPGTAEDRERFEESLDAEEGLTAEEGSSRIADLMEAAREADTDVDVEGADPEVLEAAQEALEEGGSIEAAQETLEQLFAEEQAAEAEGETEAPESVALDALAEELGLDDLSVVTTTVKVDGEEQEVSLEDLRDGHMRHRDYTRKTQELAEERQEVQQTAAEYRDGLEKLAFIEGQLGNVLAPEQKQALASEWQRVTGRLTEQALPSPEDLQQEQQALREQFGWDDPETWDEARSNLRQYATEDLGFSEQALANVHDHRLMTVLEKARRFDALQGDAEKIRNSKPKSPRKMKPGTTTDTSKDPGAEALKRHQREQNTESAAAAILDAGLLGEGS